MRIQADAGKQQPTGETIAGEVGYEDCSFFGRLFHRKVSLTPSQYRRRFGALHHVLQGSAKTIAGDAKAPVL